MFALLSLLILPAQATRVDFRSVSCPVDSSTARVFVKVSANTHGGWDSDLAAYSTKGQWREYAISTCPDSLYTVYGADMDTVLDEAVAQASLARLKELRAEHGWTAGGVETWERYLIAYEMYKLQGRPHDFLAQVLLEGSWTARDLAVGVYVGLEGPIPAAALLEAGEAELDKDLMPQARKVLLHNLARVAHRQGFNEARDRYLLLFEQAGDLDAAERAALATFKRVAYEIEPRLQRMAVAELQAFLATEPSDPTKMMRATYLLADLARRLGKNDEAVRGYGLVAVSSASPQDLRELAAWLGARLDPIED